MQHEINVLIMDDDEDFANYIYDVMQGFGAHSKVTTRSQEFMQAYNAQISLIFLDLSIPEIDGIELLRFLHHNNYQNNIILMSGMDQKTIQTALAFGESIGLNIVDHFQKPIRLIKLEEMIKKHLLVQSKANSNPKSEFVVSKNELEMAIKKNEFIVYYQPKIDIDSEKLIGVEALVRWQYAPNQLILPDQFIHYAEEYHLIDDLTWWVTRQALKDLEYFYDKTKLEVKLSINLSPYSLNDTSFPDKFVALLSESKIQPENIILEVTESGLARELSNELDILARLRLKGIQLSIDDFGTGYAMMKQLQHVPANEIKIDKSFVMTIFNNESSAITVKKIIEIGKALKMKVTAEGVETHEQAMFLKFHHCDYAQGFYFSKPLPIQDLIQWADQKYKTITPSKF